MWSGHCFSFTTSASRFLTIGPAQQRRDFRNRLFYAHSRCPIQHSRKQAERDEVFLSRSGRGRRAVERDQKTLHGDLPKRPASPRPGLLVLYALRPASLPCTEQ